MDDAGQKLWAVVVMLGMDEFAEDGHHPRFLAFFEHESDAIRWAESAKRARERSGQRGRVDVRALNVYGTDETTEFVSELDGEEE